MAGLPTIQVLLDDGSGNYPFDVTGYVNLRAGISITRGRPDEGQDVEASTLNLQLDNADGRFTAGVDGPYDVYVDQLIRVVYVRGATSSVRFTGYVQEWPTVWDTPTGGLAVARITATDRLPRLARHTLQQMTVEDTLLEAPLAFYPLREDEGSRTGGDVSGNGNDSLEPDGDRSAKVVREHDDPATKADERETDPIDLTPTFGHSMGAPPLGSGVHLKWFTPWQKAHLTTGTQYNRPQVLRTKLSKRITTDAMTVSFFLRTNVEPDSYDLSDMPKVLDLDWLVVQIEPTGILWVKAEGIPAVEGLGVDIADGDPHHVAIRVKTEDIRGSGSSPLYSRTIRLMVDGVGQDNATTITRVDTAQTRSVQLGGHDFTGTISHLAFWDSYVGADTLRRIGDLGLNGAGGDSPEARLSRIGSYAGVRTVLPRTIPQTIPFDIGGTDPGLTAEPGVTRHLTHQSIAGASMLDAARAIERSEGGLLFIDGAGRLIMHNRRHRSLSASNPAKLTISADQLAWQDFTTSADAQRLVNQASGAAFRSGRQTIKAQGSIDKHELYPVELDELLIDNDRDVRARLQWIVSTYKEPIPRVATIPLDVLTVPTTTQQTILTLELQDRVTVTNLPPQAPATTLDTLIEGWTETLTDTSWTMVLNTSPTEPHLVWFLNSGVLGAASTRVGY